MNRAVFAVALLALVSHVVVAGDIVVPEDNSPFKVKEGDVVRIPVATVAGAQVKARVSASSQVTVHTVTTRVKGKMPAGMGSHEVEVKPKVKGKVTLYVTTTLPNGKETTEVYQFEVE